MVGVTGASGAIYAQRLLQAVEGAFDRIDLVMSDQAMQVAETELGVQLNRQQWTTLNWLGYESKKIHLLGERDYFTPPASGSYRHDGMVIIPCSMGSAGRIANGISNDLLTRAADVCLKERRPLILVPREMPWSLIMLRNLTTLAEAGATILPACPAWYGKPSSLAELADTVVARVLQQLGLDQQLVPEWQAGRVNG